MPGKISIRSRYRNLPIIYENEGQVIFVPPRRPLPRKDFPDNIVHTVLDSDRCETISSLYYGVPHFDWVIADFNNFLFMDEDLHKVTKIVLPSLVTLTTEILPELSR